MGRIEMPHYSQNDVRRFISFGKEELKHNKRYLSFDYCYGYFHSHKSNLIGKNMEHSCMALWSYLASWGMLRGSSQLLQNGNYKVLKDTIILIQEYFKKSQALLPCIKSNTVEEYARNTVNLCKNIRDSLKKGMPGLNPTNTLVTKIVLGVFGEFPALDTNFCKTFGGGTSIKGFAERVWSFYHNELYKSIVDEFVDNIPVQSFDGKDTSWKYPIAKLIDMFGFFYGMNN